MARSLRDMIHQHRKQAEPQPAKPLPITKPPDHKLPKHVGKETLVGTCGHKFDFLHYEKDPNREARKKKDLGRACPACRKFEHAVTLEASARVKKLLQGKKKLSGCKLYRRVTRLPGGSNFNLTYNDKTGCWDGVLSIPVKEYPLPLLFVDNQRAVKYLMEKLDKQWRTWQPPEGCPLPEELKDREEVWVDFFGNIVDPQKPSEEKQAETP